jgi:hypothetical protein
LFNRDLDGHLIRLDDPAEEDYLTMVTVQVDGRPVKLPIARPLEDAQRASVLDMDGRKTPRYTTVLDAVIELNKLNNERGKVCRMPAARCSCGRWTGKNSTSRPSATGRT